MNQQQLIEQILQRARENCRYESGVDTVGFIYLSQLEEILNDAGASWMQGEGERLRECYTKEQVIAAIKEECIATYGGLSHDGEGNEINTPYTCLGIIHAAFDRLTPKP